MEGPAAKSAGVAATDARRRGSDGHRHARRTADPTRLPAVGGRRRVGRAVAARRARGIAGRGRRARRLGDRRRIGRSVADRAGPLLRSELPRPRLGRGAGALSAGGRAGDLRGGQRRRDQPHAGRTAGLAYAFLHAGRTGILPARRYIHGRAAAPRSGAGVSRRPHLLSGHRHPLAHRRGGRPHRHRRDRGDAGAPGGTAGRRRNPRRRRGAVPAGRLVPRQGRDAGGAGAAARGRARAGPGDARRSRTQPDVPGRHGGERPGGPGERPPDRLRACLELRRLFLPARAGAADRRGPAAGRRRADLGPARRLGRRGARGPWTCSTRARRRCGSPPATARTSSRT